MTISSRLRRTGAIALALALFTGTVTAGLTGSLLGPQLIKRAACGGEGKKQESQSTGSRADRTTDGAASDPPGKGNGCGPIPAELASFDNAVGEVGNIGAKLVFILLPAIALLAFMLHLFGGLFDGGRSGSRGLGLLAKCAIVALCVASLGGIVA